MSKASSSAEKSTTCRCLPDEVVRFIGEKVAVVAAENEEIAEAATELIEVEYDELEPLLDPLEADPAERDHCCIPMCNPIAACCTK